MNMEYCALGKTIDDLIGRNGICELVSWLCGKVLLSCCNSKEFEVVK